MRSEAITRFPRAASAAQSRVPTAPAAILCRQERRRDHRVDPQAIVLDVDRIDRTYEKQSDRVSPVSPISPVSPLNALDAGNRLKSEAYIKERRNERRKRRERLKRAWERRRRTEIADGALV